METVGSLSLSQHPLLKNLLLLGSCLLLALSPQHTAAQFTTLYHFTGLDDGGQVLGGVVLDPTGTILYGTTTSGGAYTPPPGEPWYGSPSGTVYAYNRSTSKLTVLHYFGGPDGAKPQGTLALDSTEGILYGTTSQGGSWGGGTVFAIDISAAMSTPQAGFTTLHDFVGTDGSNPTGGVVLDGTRSILYGTTTTGDPDVGPVWNGSGNGTVFALEISAAMMLPPLNFSPGAGLTTLHSFSGGDGSFPSAGVILDPTGAFLYGATVRGGGAVSFYDGAGTVFAIKVSDAMVNAHAGFTLLHAFTLGSDGGQPYGGLVLDPTGPTLYGTTSEGGGVVGAVFGNGGTVFGIDVNTAMATLGAAGFRTVYTFTGYSDGAHPWGSLVLDPTGTILYGTASVGGSAYSSSWGAVFSVNSLANSQGLTASPLVPLHSFAWPQGGGGPLAGLTQDPKRQVLYGTTEYTYANQGWGTVFSISTVPSVISGLPASQAISYGTPSVVLSGKVSGPGNLYPGAGESISVTINGNTQTASIDPNTGEFSVDYNSAAIPASATPYTITYSYAGNASLISASDNSTTLTVLRDTPGFSNLTPNQPLPACTTSVTLGGKLSAAGGVCPPQGDTVTVSINGSPQTTQINDGTGDFSLPYDLSTLGAGSYTIKYSYAAHGSFNAAPDDTSTTLTRFDTTPVAAPIILGARQGAVCSAPEAALLAGASAPGGGALSIAVASSSTAGAAASLANGYLTLDYSVVPNVSGADTVSYTLTDGCASKLFTIAVNVAAVGTSPISQGVAAPGQTVTVAVPPTAGQSGAAAVLTTAAGNPNATVTLLAYPGYPGSGSTAFGAGSSYFDLNVKGAAGGDTMTAFFYYPYTAGQTPPALEYQDGTGWHQVLSDSSPPSPATAPTPTQVVVNGSKMWQYTVVFDGPGTPESTPEITQLPGTVIALAMPAAPTVVCSDIQVNQDPGVCGAVVPFAATVTGFPAPTVGYGMNLPYGGPWETIQSPYFFPVGVTTVYAYASNAHGSEQCAFTVTVVNVNPPVVGVNTLATLPNQPVSVAVSTVLQNASAPSGGPLSIPLVTWGTAKGGSAMLAGGQITYTPPAGFLGTDTISYTLSDGCGTATGTITVTVALPAVPPTITLGAAYRLEGPGGGNDCIVVGASAPGVAWTATVAPNTPWLTLAGGPTTISFQGSANVVFNCQQNSGMTQPGVITFTCGAQTTNFSVIQAGSTYTYDTFTASPLPLAQLVPATAGLSQPWGVAVDSLGNVYIADSANNAIYEWTYPNGGGGLIQLPTALASGGNLNHPQSVCVDGAGNIYVADAWNHAIQMLAAGWTASSTWTTLLGPYWTGGPLTDPVGVAVDGAGNLYVADNGTIFEWQPASGTGFTLLSAGTGFSFPPGLSAGTFQPVGVAVDAAGNVYTADQGNDVVEQWMPASGSLNVLALPYWRGGPLGTVAGVAVDGAGNVLIADAGGNQIFEWTAVTGLVAPLIPYTAGLQWSQGVAVDGVGNVYVADTGNQVVKALPYALVDPTPRRELASGGADALPPVLPTSANLDLSGPFAPQFTGTGSSPLALISMGTANGVVSYSVAPNLSGATETGVFTVLGATIPVNQAGPAVTSVGNLLQWWGAGEWDNWQWDAGGQTYTVGETFTAPAGASALSSFTFFLEANYGSQVSLQAEVFNWSGPVVPNSGWAPQGTTGGALYSAPLDYTASGGLQPITVTIPGGVPLIPGQTYVVDFTIPPGSAGDLYFGEVYTPVAAVLGALNGSLYPATEFGTWAEPYWLAYYNPPKNLAISLSFVSGPANALGALARLEGPGAGSDSVVFSASSPTTTWTASVDAQDAGWLQLTGPGTLSQGVLSSMGSGNLGFTCLAQNPGSGTRTGTVTLTTGDGQTLSFTVTQAGSTYSYGTFTAPSQAVTTVSSITPSCLAVDAAGDLFAPDTSSSGTVYFFAPWNNFWQDALVWPWALLPGFTPSGLAVDNDGNLYIADLRNAVVYLWSSSNPYGEATALVSGLNSPTGVAVDAAGNLYISDSGNNTIYEWTPGLGLSPLVSRSSTFLGSVAAGSFSPVGLAVDAAGNVYIVDGGNNAIEEWTPGSGALTVLVASSASGGPLHNPTGVAVDGGGNVFISDAGANAVFEWSAANGAVAPLVASGLAQPAGVAVDGTGNVYIADPGNNRLAELPYAFMDPTPESGPATGGFVVPPPVLPATVNLLGPFAPTSDSPSWLRYWGSYNGTVDFAISPNETGASRAGNLIMLGASVPVTQNALPLPSLPTSCYPPPAGLVNWWPGQNNANDIVGNDNAISGGADTVTYTTGNDGQPNHAFYFDGNDYLVTAGQVANPQNFTWECWFNTTWAQGGYQVLMAFCAPSGGAGSSVRMVYMDTQGNPSFAAGNTFQSVGTSSFYNDGSWHHLAATLYAASDASLYVDGVLVGNSAYWGGNQDYTPCTGYWAIGGGPSSDLAPGWFLNFNGAIAGVSIYDRPLSPTEIQNLYLAGLAGYGKCQNALPTGSIGLGAAQRVEGPGGGRDSVVLGASSPNTAWTATVVQGSTWLSLPASGGLGSGTVVFTCQPNSTGTQTGVIRFACGSQTIDFTVVQAGSTYTHNTFTATPRLVSPLISAAGAPAGFTPQGAAVDGAGNIYVASGAAGSTAGGVYEWTYPNGGGGLAQLPALPSPGWTQANPQAICVHAKGNVYVADAGNQAIFELAAGWTPGSTWSTLTGQSQWLNSPAGVAVDAAGNVYFTDSANNALYEWLTPAGPTITLPTQFAAGGALSAPHGVAVDAAGNVYVADTGNGSVDEWTPGSPWLTTIVSSTANGGPLTTPTGVAVDGAGNVFITDSGANAIYEYTAATSQVTTLVPSGLNQPAGVAVDSAGSVYIADTGNQAVKELPLAFVDPTPKSEAASGGNDALPPVLPGTVNLDLSGPFAPAFAGTGTPSLAASITGTAYGVVNYSVAPNAGSSLLTGAFSLLGATIPVAQGVAGTAYAAGAAAPPQQSATVVVPPGSGTAAGVTATLVNNDSSGSPKTIAASAYAGDPVVGDNAFGAGGSASASFLDLRVSGAAPSDSLTSTFYYPDTGGPAPVLEYYNGTAWVAVLSDSSPPNAASAPAPIAATVNGTLMWQYTVVFDGASTPEITQLTGTIFALDTPAAPTISCPANLQVNQDPGSCSALVTFPAPTVTGFPTPSVTCLLNGVPITSPYTFPVGVSTVNCTASSSAGSDACAFTITVLEDHPPVASVHALGTSQGQAASVPVAKVLLRDQSPGGGPLSISSVVSPTANGATVSLGGGRITYTPTATFVGQDTITYHLTDGCGTVPGTIVVTVLATSLPGANSLSITATPTSTTVVFAGIPRATYVVQSAPAVSGPWSSLSGNLTAAANGLIQYTDTTLPRPSARYYRTQYISGP